MVAASILLVSTDSGMISHLRRTISPTGYQVQVVRSLAEADTACASQGFDAVVVHLDASKTSVRRRLADGFQFRREPPVIALAKTGTIGDAVRAIRAGAIDYLSGRPLNAHTIRNALRRAVSRKFAGILESRVNLSGNGMFQAFVTSDYRMRGACETVASVADSKATLLIVGESGTGKTLVARMLHANSLRRLGPFVELNCGVLSDSLLESELFGHVRGAFTSACRERRGKFELANGGTILLDEIANSSMSLQSKLLRVVETGTVTRLGDTRPIHCDVRLVVATNTLLEEKVNQGLFREDLLHRLNAVRVELPPLRDRVGDIPLLARYFLRLFSLQHKRAIRSISADAMDRLVRYQWPGNVRELRNVIEHGVILASGGTIHCESLPQHVAACIRHRRTRQPCLGLRPLRDAMREPERLLILRALRASGGNKQDAAKKLGISRSTLYKKMKEHCLGEFEPAHGRMTLGVIGAG